MDPSATTWWWWEEVRQVSVPRSCWAGRQVAGSGVEIVEDRVTGIERGSANSSSWRDGYLARTSLAKE